MLCFRKRRGAGLRVAAVGVMLGPLLGGAEGVWHDAPVPSWLRRAQASVFADVG
jgi:hypothetical protein